MPDDRNNCGSPLPDPLPRRHPATALEWGPRKKPCATDPLVHHGRHFGRAVHALCSVQVLILNGILRAGERADDPEESFSPEERREHRVYETLLKMIPNFEERVMNASEEEVVMIAELLQKGASSARSDDTKSLKSVIIDWITPRGQSLSPPLARNIKIDRGFNHDVTGALLCPTGLDWSNSEVKEQLRSGTYAVAGDQWPIFVYKDSKYDPENPWEGLFRSAILVSTYKHIFTSPSSVDKEPKATRSGNARIHGMTSVTPASIAYVATQARFAPTSSAVFTRSDTVTDSERFYTSILDLFEDPEENVEVNELLLWWNRQIFPSHSSSKRPVTKESALAKIKEKRAALKAAALTPRNHD